MDQKLLHMLGVGDEAPSRGAIGGKIFMFFYKNNLVLRPF